MLYPEETPKNDKREIEEPSIPILDGTAGVDFFEDSTEVVEKNKLEVLIDLLKKKL